MHRIFVAHCQSLLSTSSVLASLTLEVPKPVNVLLYVARLPWKGGFRFLASPSPWSHQWNWQNSELLGRPLFRPLPWPFPTLMPFHSEVEQVHFGMSLSVFPPGINNTEIYSMEYGISSLLWRFYNML